MTQHERTVLGEAARALGAAKHELELATFRIYAVLTDAAIKEVEAPQKGEPTFLDKADAQQELERADARAEAEELHRILEEDSTDEAGFQGCCREGEDDTTDEALVVAT